MTIKPLSIAAVRPVAEHISNIKSKLLKPALTSHFICEFNPPSEVAKFIQGRIGSGIPGINYGNGDDSSLLRLSCTEASLPGSSLATIDIDNDFHGVSEKHAYRRLYYYRADFTFIVDGDYNIIGFFCVGENLLENQKKVNYNYRVNYPENYMTENLYITKFERDFNVGPNRKQFQYKFMNAYPLSITSMPVSYDTSGLLKCTVSFFYSRYVIGEVSSVYSSIPLKENSRKPT
jgi:hypothetical protein